MKKSEKIGIGIVTVLAIILIAILLSGDSKKEKKQNFCNELCYNSGSEMWSMMTEPRDDYNRYSTKNECVNACLLKK